MILLRVPSPRVGWGSRTFKGVDPGNGFCRELSRMGRAVPERVGAGEAVVWVYLVHGSHDTLGNKQPFSQRAAALGK